ncbi:TetR/AcrR family transcriptional regulator [Demequina sp. SO4-13]|uniref:TetR/AcrR family transcriptional regulator n=1 Tax=Demequina sp. SO4-13 TaxID=3401027 RepID=UPI003AF888DA
MSDDEARRMSAGDRREQILAAASRVFGERGYAGGTTDAIAREAGVSQAYVVRMFGGKENLFKEAAERASRLVLEVFRDTIAGFTGDETAHDKRMALAVAYTNLVSDRGTLLTLLHLFSLGHDATFGPLGRACFLNVYRATRDEAGLTSQEASDFFAQGMLTTVLLAMRMPEAAGDPAAMDLMSCTFGEHVTDLIQLTSMQAPLQPGSR